MKKLLLTTAALMLVAPSVNAATYCVRPVISQMTGATLYCTRDLSLDPSDPACTCGGNLAGDDEGAGMKRYVRDLLLDSITPVGFPVDPDDDLVPDEDEPVDDGDDEPVDDPVDDGDDPTDPVDDGGDDEPVDDGEDDGDEDDGDNGHGNDDDHDDDSNPGKGGGKK